MTKFNTLFLHTAPTAPQDFEVTVVDPTTLRLSWSEPMDNGGVLEYRAMKY